MKRTPQKTPVLKESDLKRLVNNNSSLELELPAADEFLWTNEEVREVCAGFRDIEGFERTS